MSLVAAFRPLVRPLFVADLFATWLNAWCVSARFSVVAPCRFCGVCGPDALHSLFLCPAVHATIFRLLSLAPPTSLAMAFCLGDCPRDEMRLRILAVHLSRAVHNSIRALSRRPSLANIWQLALQRFRKLARDSPRERALLLFVQPPAHFVPD